MRIYYNENGFVCDVFPYYKKTDTSRFLEVNKEEYASVFITKSNFAWKVLNGKLVNIDVRSESEILAAKLTELRNCRKEKCFSVINRGKIWYDTLSDTQLQELKVWYLAWLNVTTTLVEPTMPTWLK